MPHTEKHAIDPSIDDPQTLASRNRGDDGLPADEEIRGRAYELYRERGSQPGDGVGDWLQAEREYYGQQ